MDAPVRTSHSSLLEKAISPQRKRFAICLQETELRVAAGGDLIWIWNEAPSVGERGGELNCGAAGCSLSLVPELVPPAPASLSRPLPLPLRLPPSSALSIHKALLI